MSEPGISGWEMLFLGSDLSERMAEELKDPAYKIEVRGGLFGSGWIAPILEG